MAHIFYTSGSGTGQFKLQSPLIKAVNSNIKSDTSSPDGSYNSPRSSGSNSPIRSDTKKKGKSTSKDNSPSTPTSLSSFASFRDKKKDAKGKGSQSSTPTKNLEEVKETSPSVQVEEKESFFGYGSRDKGNGLGASNLSKTGGNGPLSSAWGKKNSGKKDEKKSLLGSTENAGRVDNVSNSDGMSAESAALRDRSPHIPDYQGCRVVNHLLGAG
ncbi:hypothetical protein HAX54_024341 [Datura stramonium]|uniref:Uncharacterized protein n=1 Tax=Datura stramonium TaxID=4076 RepID=A0ABS8S7L5_DATST|nr:hypothetical protein [Datura stramonium]